MQKKKVVFKEVSTEKFIESIFILLSIFLLSSIIWSKERNVNNYYQNLLIVSFSVATTILHICYEIRDNKNNELFPPPYINFGYASSKLLIALCCVTPLCLYTASNQNDVIYAHMYYNCYWGACLATFIPIVYTCFWGYIYPLVSDIPYDGVKIRYAERTE